MILDICPYLRAYYTPVATSIQRELGESRGELPSTDEMWKGFLEEYTEGARAAFSDDTQA